MKDIVIIVMLSVFALNKALPKAGHSQAYKGIVRIVLNK